MRGVPQFGVKHDLNLAVVIDTASFTGYTYDAVLDLAGNSGTVFTESFGKRPEGKILSKTIFYFQSPFKCCIMGHVKPSFLGHGIPL